MVLHQLSQTGALLLPTAICDEQWLQRTRPGASITQGALFT
jgi:hypothetical protein